MRLRRKARSCALSRRLGGWNDRLVHVASLSAARYRWVFENLMIAWILEKGKKMTRFYFRAAASTGMPTNMPYIRLLNAVCGLNVTLANPNRCKRVFVAIA
jgi:hypothetical protein